MNKDYHPLSGHTELYKKGESVDTYLKITRHMVRKNKTYLMYYFDNPRKNNPNKDSREPDVYRYYFRILWKDEPILQKHRQYISTQQSDGSIQKIGTGHWVNCSKDDDFNLFPNYTVMVDKVKSLIAEYELLYSLTDSNYSHIKGVL